MTIRNLDFLLRPRRIVVCGAPHTEGQQQMLANIEASKAIRQHHALGFERPNWERVRPKALPACDLAVVFEPGSLTPETLGALARQECKALLWASAEGPSRDLLEAARPYSLRVLGGRSGGVAWPGLSLNLSAYYQPLGKGKVALIAQSSSVAAAALDWAAGRELGFSWMAVTGAEADVDVGDLLDVAAVDPMTRAVVLQMSRVKSARKFMSAARACARNKPVLVLHSPPLSIGLRDPVRSAALQRAGLIECEVLGGLFDGIAALERLPNLRRFRVLVVGNGAGVCALGLAAIGRHGLMYAELSREAQACVRAQFAGARFLPGAVDLSSAPPAVIAAVLTPLLADPGVDAVLLMHSPRPGQAHTDTARAVAGSAPGPNLLTVWLGLETAMEARFFSSEQAVSTFASADEAMRALRYRLQYRRTQEMLMQTPPPLDLPPVDREQVSRILLRTASRQKRLLAGKARRLLAHYGLTTEGEGVLSELIVEVALLRHEEFGLYLRVRGEGLWSGRGEAHGFVPLDALLAERLLDDAGIAAALERRRWSSALYAAMLMRVGQMLSDQTALAAARLRFAPDVRGRPVLLPDSELELTAEPLPARQRLVLASYPAELAHDITLKEGRTFQVRPVRADDEANVIRLLERSDPENIRLRFFGYIRQFSHEMAARLTQLDYDREIAFVAMPRGASSIVGLAHLMADPDGQRAEFSLLVHQDYARVGLGRHLLRELVRHGRRRGVAVVFGEILAENRPMLSLARALGFRIRHQPDDPGSLRAEIDTATPADAGA